MYKDWTALRADLDEPFATYRAASPDVAKAFGRFVREAGRPGTPECAEQELLALALGVAARCEGCLAIHAKALVGAEVSRERVVRALDMAVTFGGGPAFTYAALALEAFDQFAETNLEATRDDARSVA